MSAYYGSMLPSTSLASVNPGSGLNPDPLYPPLDSKFDPSSGSPGSFFAPPSGQSHTGASLSRYEGCSPAMDVFSRYAASVSGGPFERFDVTGAKGSPYMTSSNVTSSPGSFGHPHYLSSPTYASGLGHAPPNAAGYDADHGDTSPNGSSNLMTSLHHQAGVSGAPAGVGGGAHPHAVSMMTNFNHNPLAGIMNGLHGSATPQNIPIYPWMRPMNGGKQNTF